MLDAILLDTPSIFQRLTYTISIRYRRDDSELLGCGIRGVNQNQINYGKGEAGSAGNASPRHARQIRTRVQRTANVRAKKGISGGIFFFSLRAYGY